MTPIPDHPNTAIIELFGNAYMRVTDQPIGGADVYELIFFDVMLGDDRTRPITVAAERDDARQLRDHLTRILDESPGRRPARGPLEAIAGDRASGRAARRRIARA